MNTNELKIILDSTSGYSKSTLEKNGFAFIPQQVIIDDKQYLDGENIELKETIKLMEASSKVQTSQPAYGNLVEIIKELAQKYQFVIFMPMNKGISSTYEVAAKIADEFDNVAVIANSLFGSAMIDAATRANDTFIKNQKIQDAINVVEHVNDNSLCYIAPKNLDGFIRGGRLRGSKRFILTRVNLLPRLLIKNEGIKVSGVKRSFSKLISSIVEKIISKIGREKIEDYHWEIIHTYDKETIEIAEKNLKAIGVKQFLKTPAPSIVGIHAGIGSLAINVWPKN